MIPFFLSASLHHHLYGVLSSTTNTAPVVDDDEDDGMKNFLVPSTNCRLLFFRFEFFLRLEDANKRLFLHFKNHQHGIVAIFDFRRRTGCSLKEASVSRRLLVYCCNLRHKRTFIDKTLINQLTHTHKCNNGKT